MDSSELSITSSTAAAPLVFIVDDDVDSCEMYSTCVKAAGLRVAQAHDGASAFEHALRALPDLLVTDLVMPGLDGFELTRRLRETRQMKGLPVIAVTARTIADEEVTRLEFGGPTSLLLKPCEPIRLLVEIWKLLLSGGVRRPLSAPLSDHSPIIWTTTSRSRPRVSNSISITCCHVPRIKDASLKGIVSEGPSRAART